MIRSYGTGHLTIQNRHAVFLYSLGCLTAKMHKVSHNADVIKWKHIPHYWPFVRGIHRSPVNSPHKGQWRRALMFSLICAWMNNRVNNREADDWRRQRVHYDVTVMCFVFLSGPILRKYVRKIIGDKAQVRISCSKFRVVVTFMDYHICVVYLTR